MSLRIESTIHCTVTVETVQVKSSACRPYISHHCSWAVILLNSCCVSIRPQEGRSGLSAPVFQVEVLGHFSLIRSYYGIHLKDAAKMKNCTVSVLFCISNKNEIRPKKKKKESGKRKNLCFLPTEDNKTERGQKKWYKMESSLPRNPSSKMSSSYRQLGFTCCLLEPYWMRHEEGDNIFIIFKTPTSFCW